MVRSFVATVAMTIEFPLRVVLYPAPDPWFLYGLLSRNPAAFPAR